ncbi:unnamed protein product [Didymodactylos carnosus]|uniref:DDE Tnp4 domain-containing protein n=1 Tax=Didymodactylos carnosus TaxID=1234261 RepID=A0A8S2F8T3_9BILA|nr:unnamed protein product [Didymodactylos carnosus]CAF4184008.1 unnamed protein product [Didymodactylos carnosus]
MKQHTAEEANDSRLVTKIRWVVEAYYSRMKKWRFLSERVKNSMTPHLKSCVQIISAVLNVYRPRTTELVDPQAQKTLAMSMKQRAAMQNDLKQREEFRKLSSKSK